MNRLPPLLEPPVYAQRDRLLQPVPGCVSPDQALNLPDFERALMTEWRHGEELCTDNMESNGLSGGDIQPRM